MGLLTASLESSRKSGAQERDASLQRLKDNEDLRDKVLELEERLGGHERRLSEAPETDSERLMRERDDLTSENARLKRFAVASGKRAEKEARSLKAEIEALRSELDREKKQKEELEERLREQTSTNAFLREDLTKSRGESLDLRTRSEALERELAASRDSESHWQDLDQCSRAMGREIGQCLEELQGCVSISHSTSYLRIFTSSFFLVLVFGLGFNKEINWTPYLWY